MNIQSLMKLAVLVALLMTLTFSSVAQVPVALETLEQTAERLAGDVLGLKSFMVKAFPNLSEPQRERFISHLQFCLAMQSIDRSLEENKDFAEQFKQAEHVGEIKGMAKLAWADTNTGSFIYLTTVIYPDLSTNDQKLLIRELVKLMIGPDGKPVKKPGVEIILPPDGGIVPPAELPSFKVPNEIVNVTGPPTEPSSILTKNMTAPATEGVVAGFVETEATVRRGAQFGQLNSYIGWKKYFVWVQIDTKYAQIYGGRSFNFHSFEFGLGIGIEQNKNPIRFGAYMDRQYRRLHQNGIFEMGGSGPWFKNETNLEVTKRFDVGLFGQRGVGWGPRAAIKFRHSEFWGAFTEQKRKTDGGGAVFLFGLRRYFH